MPSLALTPRGHLLWTGAGGAPQQEAAGLARALEGAFARGSGHGLLELGTGEVGTALPADVSYWRFIPTMWRFVPYQTTSGDAQSVAIGVRVNLHDDSLDGHTRCLSASDGLHPDESGGF